MRAEILVFGIIAAIVILGTFAIKVPLMADSGSNSSASSLPSLGKAPEFAGIANWLNTEPLTIQGLRGKVVLIDFWTYSCINCIRTLPYLVDWYSKYSGMGLVIVGVHTPEFEFEKDPGNVLAALEKYGIKYPVAQDNSYGTWDAYNNQYWPRHYLIDKTGEIRYDHIGEGSYDETEKAIRELLGENASGGNMTGNLTSVDFSQIGTPEIYLGYRLARQPLGNDEGFVHDQTVDYKQVNATGINTVYLSGQWQDNPENIAAVNNSKLFLIYKARNVDIVAGGNATLNVKLDSNALLANQLGQDAANNGTVAINSQRLYNIVSTPDYGYHLLEIDASPGFELYTFTFG